MSVTGPSAVSPLFADFEGYCTGLACQCGFKVYQIQMDGLLLNVVV